MTMQVLRNRSISAGLAFAPLLTAAFVLATIFTGSTAGADQASGIPHAPPVANADFGSPPSGEIPILYNDHTVYTKPDILRKSRVLAAFVKDHQIYVPLRSMFEQMGATVTASADGKTFTATKPGTSVSVRLGSSEVTINGETRPLDVPPMIYQGVVLVPVRVISEALGAYVLWVADRRLVVVRYIPAVPPTPVPTPEPTVAPTPSPTPTPVPEEQTTQAFIQAAMSHPSTYNEFSSGQFCPKSYLVAAAYIFKNSPFAIKGDYRSDSYVTNDNLTVAGNQFTSFATIDGGMANTPVFLARQTNVDARLEYQIAAPRIYLGVGYIQTSTNYGYPHLNGVGVGLEKLPELRNGIGFFGSAFYYPTASGNYTLNDPASSNNGKTYRQQYQIMKYDIGLALSSAHFPIYLYGGYAGDRYTAKQNAPIGQTHNGPYLGLGLKF